MRATTWVGLETLHRVKEAGREKPPVTWFFLPEVSRMGKSIERNPMSACQRAGEAEWRVNINARRHFPGVRKTLDLERGGSCPTPGCTVLLSCSLSMVCYVRSEFRVFCGVCKSHTGSSRAFGPLIWVAVYRVMLCRMLQWTSMCCSKILKV